MDFPKHQLRNVFWLLLSAYLFCFTPCHAKDDTFSEQSFLQDIPVVLSASRLKQPLSEAPNAVTVIDRAMIKASGFRTVADLFKLVPGMYVGYKNGYTPIVSYRGGTDEYTRRMQVLVDGRSVYLEPFNTVAWEDLPLQMDDIERIEVVRGPAATSYGSNSVMGVINIITRDASALNGPSISATNGNAGISDAVAHFGRSGEQLDYRLTFGMRSDNGFNFPINAPTYSGGYNDSSATHFASLRGNYRLSGTDSLDLQLGFSNGVRAEGDPKNQNSQPHNIKNDSGYQQLTWLHTLDQGDDIQMRYYHISRNSVNEWPTLPIAGLGGPFSLSDNSKVHRHELELQHTLHTSSDNRLVWGMAARHDSVDAPTTLSAAQSLRQYRLFAHDEWRILPKLLLNAGAMLEDDGLDHKKVSPRIALNYHITPENTLRAGVSVAYRSPSLAEERSDYQFKLSGTGLTYRSWFSSGGLRPERTLSREIGYIGKFGNSWSVDVRAYNDQVSDIIWIDNNWMPDPTNVNKLFGLSLPIDFRNMFTAQYTGLESSVKYSWGEARNSLTLSFAHQLVSCAPTGSPYISHLSDAALAGGTETAAYIRNFVLSRYAGQVQDYTKTAPLNSGSLLYIGQLSENISFSAGYYQQGTVMIFDGKLQPLTRQMDMRIAKQFGPAGGRFKKIGGGEVVLTVQNVFQNNNGEQVGYSSYLFDRRAYLTATVNF